MAKLTLRQVNAAIQARGIAAELVKDRDYFWFFGDAVEHAYSTSVYVYRLNDLTLAEWMRELDAILEDHENRKPPEQLNYEN